MVHIEASSHHAGGTSPAISTRGTVVRAWIALVLVVGGCGGKVAIDASDAGIDAAPMCTGMCTDELPTEQFHSIEAAQAGIAGNWQACKAGGNATPGEVFTPMGPDDGYYGGGTYIRYQIIMEDGVAHLHLKWRLTTAEADMALRYAPCPLRQLLTTISTPTSGPLINDRYAYVP